MLCSASFHLSSANVSFQATSLISGGACVLPEEDLEIQIRSDRCAARHRTSAEHGERRPGPLAGRFSSAAELARQAGDYDRFGRAALGFADLIPTPGALDMEAVGMLEEALQQLGQAESALRAMVLARLGNELSFSEQPERREPASRGGRLRWRVASTTGHTRLHPRPVICGLTSMLLKRSTSRMNRWKRRYAAEQVRGTARAHNWLVTRFMVLGDRAGFERGVVEEERLQRELRILDYWTGLHHALLARMDGRFDETVVVRSGVRRPAARRPENAARGLGLPSLTSVGIRVACSRWEARSGERRADALQSSLGAPRSFRWPSVTCVDETTRGRSSTDWPNEGSATSANRPRPYPPAPQASFPTPAGSSATTRERRSSTECCCRTTGSAW